MKKLLRTQTNDQMHWVGDGFPVRTIFAYTRHAAELSPFLMLDYAAPREFEPSETIRGVGEHPHRGFETVTIVYAGEIEHRDSAGGGGAIGPGDVQWMTAGSGLVHEEMHGREFAKRGGAFEMVQLWVNLPARSKMTAPRYQEIRDAQIPQVRLPDDAGVARLIAGRLGEAVGPAETHTPMSVWDVRVAAGKRVRLEIAAGHNAHVFVLSGAVTADGTRVESGAIATFSAEGADVELVAHDAAKLLVLAGEPIREPIAGYGPFVMNTAQEIHQALDDFRAGRMGRLGA